MAQDKMLQSESDSEEEIIQGRPVSDITIQGIDLADINCPECKYFYIVLAFLCRKYFQFCLKSHKIIKITNFLNSLDL